jgi:hypothetical protein
LVDAVFQQDAGGVQVEGGKALGAGKRGVGESQQGFDVGFVGAGELFGGRVHGDLLKMKVQK